MDAHDLVENVINELNITISLGEKRTLLSWIDALFLERKYKFIFYGMIIEALLGKNDIKKSLIEFIKQLSITSTGCDPIILFRKIISQNKKIFCFKGKKHVFNDYLYKLIGPEKLRTIVFPVYPVDKYYGYIDDLINDAKEGFIDPFIETISSGYIWYSGFISEYDSYKDLNNGPDFPTLVRNGLGLYHLRNCQEELIILKYFCENEEIFCPTIFDAYGHYFWRPSPENKNFGQTVDIASFEYQFSECVHGEISLKNATVREVIGSANPKLDVDWKRYEENTFKIISEIISAKGL